MAALAAISLGLAAAFILKKNTVRMPLIIGFVFSMVAILLLWQAMQNRQDILVLVSGASSVFGLTLMVAAFSMPPKNDGVQRRFTPKLLFVGLALLSLGVVSIWWVLNLQDSRQPSYFLTWQSIVKFLLFPTGLALSGTGLVLAAWGAVKGFKPNSSPSASQNEQS